MLDTLIHVRQPHIFAGRFGRVPEDGRRGRRRRRGFRSPNRGSEELSAALRRQHSWMTSSLMAQFRSVGEAKVTVGLSVGLPSTGSTPQRGR